MLREPSPCNHCVAMKLWTTSNTLTSMWTVVLQAAGKMFHGNNARILQAKTKNKQTTTITILRPFFRNHPGEPVPEGSLLLDFCGAREDIKGRHTDHLGGRHSIRTNQRPPPSSPIFMPDALPATVLPLYPGLGQTDKHQYAGLHTSGVVTCDRDLKGDMQWFFGC